MDPSLIIHDLQLLEDLFRHVILFQDAAQNAVSLLNHRVERSNRWLREELPRYWQQALLASHDLVAEARAAYETCRQRTVAGHRSACLEELQALRRARARQDYCEQQMEQVRHWGAVVQQEIDDFRGKLGPLNAILEHQLPLFVEELRQLIAAIEAYIQTQLPSSS